MGALIILHGLFLLHCNAQPKMADSLPPQYCEILSAETPGHYYRVGANYKTLVELPFRTDLSVDLPPSKDKDPDTDSLDSRMMVFDSSVVTILSNKATMRILVPMPDNIYGANVMRVFREDLLTKTDPTALRSQAGIDNRVALAETIILSYNAGKAFSLYAGDTQISGAASAQIGKNQVLAFFAWPAEPPKPGMNCATSGGMNHAGLNQLLQVNGAPPSFQLMGLGANNSLDDAAVSVFKLPAWILRPPCIKDPSVRDPRGTLTMTTATQTGCGPGVHIKP